MTVRYSQLEGLAGLGIVLAVALALSGCAGPQISSPVGDWVAVDGDHGTLSIDVDGTFVMTDASFNPLEYKDADDDFDATGTWRLAREDEELGLYFATASQSGREVETSGFIVPFRSGSIRFSDPDETVDIEFRFDSAAGN